MSLTINHFMLSVVFLHCVDSKKYLQDFVYLILMLLKK